MHTWHISENDVIVNSIVAETREIAEQLHPGCTVLDSSIQVARDWFKDTDGIWKNALPVDFDSSEYIWNVEFNRWELVNPSPEEESPVE